MRPCLKAGCPELTEATYCERHDSGERPKKKTPGPLYDSGWTKLRNFHIRKHPLCRACEIRGKVTPAHEVDHIIPWRGNVSLLRAPWNLQSLCRSCHHKKTRADELWADLKHPPPPMHGQQQLTVIWGPPAAGKTTLAHTMDQPVVDIDEIYRELGATHRMITTEITRQAMVMRNERISRPGPKILTGMFPRRHERMFWREIWRAKLIPLQADVSVLKKRIGARPFEKMGGSYQALERWLATHEDDAE